MLNIPFKKILILTTISTTIVSSYVFGADEDVLKTEKNLSVISIPKEFQDAANNVVPPLSCYGACQILGPFIATYYGQEPLWAKHGSTICTGIGGAGSFFWQSYLSSQERAVNVTKSAAADAVKPYVEQAVVDAADRAVKGSIKTAIEEAIGRTPIQSIVTQTAEAAVKPYATQELINAADRAVKDSIKTAIEEAIGRTPIQSIVTQTAEAAVKPHAKQELISAADRAVKSTDFSLAIKNSVFSILDTLPSNQVLRIESATYGCPQIGAKETKRCLAALKARCDGRQECKFTVNAEFLGQLLPDDKPIEPGKKYIDPAPDRKKELGFTYSLYGPSGKKVIGPLEVKSITDGTIRRVWVDGTKAAYDPIFNDK